MGRVTVRVPRTRVDTARGLRSDRPDTLVVEEPLELRIGDRVVATTMRTPGDDFDLALGHLLTEGLLRSAAEVATLVHCADTDDAGSPTFNVVQVTLADGVVPHRPVRERVAPMTSACGVCGSASVEAVRTSARGDVDADPVRVGADVLTRLVGTLRDHQPVFTRTGGAHAAALATATGEVVLVREDVGRHNAVDKVVGAAARVQELPLTGHVLVVSSRAGFEVVQKAAVAGVPVVVAVGAPTSLAVELAAEVGMTLAAFAREGRLSLYSRPERVAG